MSLESCISLGLYHLCSKRKLKQNLTGYRVWALFFLFSFQGGLHQERMSVAKRRDGASNCHYIYILTIVETLFHIRKFHLRKIHLRNISTAKYVTEQRILLQSSMAKKLKLRKKLPTSRPHLSSHSWIY